MTAIRFGTRTVSLGAPPVAPPDPDDTPIVSDPPPQAVFVRPRWHLFLRDADAKVFAEVDDFVKLEVILRHADVGSYALDLYRGSPSAQKLLAILQSGEVGHAGIVLVRDGTVIFSGPIATMRRTRKGTADLVTLSGPDDTIWLGRRLAMPEPATPPAPVTNAYDVRSGVASTIMRDYVNANAGPGAATARQLPGLVIGTDPLAGGTLSGFQGRYQTLLELVQAISIAGDDLGFGILSNRTGTLTFNVAPAVDRSATVKFSDGLGNLGDVDYAVTAPKANDVVVAGQGEGTARNVREVGDSASVTRWGRIESFKDRRDTNDNAQLDQSAGEDLTAKAETRTAQFTALDTPSIAFGRQYGLGDKVTVFVDGFTIVEVVREAKLTYGPGGETVEPTIGAPKANPPSLPDFLIARRDLGSRLTNLERR